MKTYAGKTYRNVGELQTSAACELASLALALTDKPTIDYGFTLNRIKQLVEVVETTATALLMHESDISWERLAAEFGGVTRQSFHRRLRRKIDDLMDLPENSVRWQQGRGGTVVEPISDQNWVSHLEKIEFLTRTAAEREYHPELVRHRRSASPAL